MIPYEPLLMVGIAVGCLLANVSSVFMTTDGSLPDALYHQDLWDAFLDKTSPYYHNYGHILAAGGLIDILYIGVKAGIYPCLIFMGIGAMTDFGPLISNPKSLLLGAAAQFGVFFAFFGANLLGFDAQQSASHDKAGTGTAGTDCCGCLQLYGADPDDPAADHESTDHRERALREDGTAS